MLTVLPRWPGGNDGRLALPARRIDLGIDLRRIIKGARHPEEARKFYDWALTVEAQKIGAANRSYQIPSNASTPIPPEAPDLSKIKLIEYDFAKYGSSAVRTAVLGRWTSEVKNAPR